MKLIDILRSASSNMLQSKLRTFLTIIAIFVGSLTLSLTTGIGNGVSVYIDKQLGSIGSKDSLTITPKIESQGLGTLSEYNPDKTTSNSEIGFSIPVLAQKDLDIIAKEDKIISVEPMLSASVEYFYFEKDSKYSTIVSPYIKGMEFEILSGEMINDESQDYEVVVPVTYLEELGINNDQVIGKTIVFGIKSANGDLEEQEAKVVGVSQQTLITGGGIVASEALIKNLRSSQLAGVPENLKNQFSSAIAYFDVNLTTDELQQLKDSLDEKGYSAMTVEDTIGTVKNVISAITAVLIFFGAIALLAASFGIINTLFMAVQERTKEIGLMKAMGMSSGKIFLLFSTEAVLIGFWGSILGIAVANMLGAVVNQIASNSFLKNLPGFDLIVFAPVSMIGVTLLIMAIAFLAGTLPARRAAAQNPIDALRYE